MKTTTNEFEHQFWCQEKLILGIDEAGRGPIAGPLVVAGVVFPIGYENEEIYDSKQLSEKKRNVLFDVIQENAISFVVEIVEPSFIDEHNIYQATKLTMINISNEVETEIVLTDAMPFSIENKKVIDIVKGDQKSISIAAASILAKVTRDRIMEEYDRMYPNYGFKQHKGYPTKQHLNALQQYGALDIHRKSYGPVSKLNQLSFDLE